MNHNQGARTLDGGTKDDEESAPFDLCFPAGDIRSKGLGFRVQGLGLGFRV